MSRFRCASPSLVCSFVVLMLLSAGMASAVQPPERWGLAEKQFRHADLDIDAVFRLPADLAKGEGAAMAAADLAALGALEDGGRLDLHGGRWATLILSHPLIPGTGVGNELTWEGLGISTPTTDEALRAAVNDAFNDYLQRNAVALRLDVAELGSARVTVHDERRGGAGLRSPSGPRRRGARQPSERGHQSRQPDSPRHQHLGRRLRLHRPDLLG